jgi:putative heme iron utilization protein
MALLRTKPLISYLKLGRSYMSMKAEKTETGHQAPNSTPPNYSKEDEALIAKFKDNQAAQKRLSFAEEVRTLIDNSICYGTLSTNSVQYEGFPTGSIVGFELDEAGKPFFVFSSMSAHTKDILMDERASLCVTAKDFKGAAEGRVVLIGNVKKVDDDARRAVLRDRYLARHKDAFWVDFGDFTWFEMEKIQALRFVGGFAMAGVISPKDYEEARPDPIAAFAAPVMKHMNDDHSESTIAMVQHYAGVPCSEATIVSIDRLGMTVKAKLTIAGGGTTKVRLSFPQPATERKAIKEVLVEMTRASAGSMPKVEEKVEEKVA